MNTFGADTDEDVTDWGQENVEHKDRIERLERQLEAFRRANESLDKELHWLRDHIRALIENDPNDDAADGVTVLDVWRKQALERLGEEPDPVRPDEEIIF